MSVKNKVFTSKLTKTIGYLLDNFLPLFIRDSRLFYKPIVSLWNSKMDVDFKRKAWKMTEEEFAAAYEAIVPMRSTDMTRKSEAFVLDNLIGESVMEVGCGNGDISVMCAKKGYKVTATDLAQGNLEEVKKKFDVEKLGITLGVANVENIPYKDNEFDTLLCLHTLEHVKNLNKAVIELKRVAKKRIIVVVPKQRFFKYTADYHLNFFGEPEQLMLTMGIENAQCTIIDNCLHYVGSLS